MGWTLCAEPDHHPTMDRAPKHCQSPQTTRDPIHELGRSAVTESYQQVWFAGHQHCAFNTLTGLVS